MALAVVAACNTPGGTPTNSPVGGTSPHAADLPQPVSATLDPGSDTPGFDGAGSFFSYDSDLSPDAAVGAYAAQLVAAGYRDGGQQGSWRVFVGPNLVVWFRVGTAGPTTTLLVRIEAATAEDVGTPTRSGTGVDSTTGDTGTSAVDGPRSSPKTTSQRRPDPPHAGTGSATATGVSRGGSSGTGTASSGTSGSGTTSGGTTSGGTTSGGSSSGGSVTGGGAAGGSSGTGAGGGGDRSRP